MSFQSPLEIWKSLEEKYNNEQQDTSIFIMLKYFEFSMIDNVTIMDQVHKLQILVCRIRELQVVVLESLQVRALISKLSSTWNDYRKKHTS